VVEREREQRPFPCPAGFLKESPVQGGVQTEIPQQVLIADQVEDQLAQLLAVQVINQKIIDTLELFGLCHGFVY
jgi:predicted component of type VI protein secretion system